jgi:Nif-specific regulatory protein
MGEPSVEQGRADDAAQRLRRERDLYATLLELGAHDRVETLIEEALALLTGLVSARQGYLEILADHGVATDPLRWHVSCGCSPSRVTEIQRALSSGIIAAAVSTGETVHTTSAILDDRFRELGSVRLNRIEAVLCVPIGADPVLGVVYLQDHDPHGAFTDDDLRCARMFARTLSIYVDRLLLRHRQGDLVDATRAQRKALRLEQFVGRSAAIADTLQQVALVAPLDVSVLLTGASGTGKTQIARILHDNSPRALQPFVEINCAALPDTLIESELFGAAAGAHSTATRRIDGKLSAADRGTLFLDEISELSPSAQAKLLQFLQSRQYYPLGSAKPSTADVRILAATNLDLHAAVKERRFREDLLYRLEVMPIRVPALAERPEDLPDLLEFFCARCCHAHHFPRLRFSRSALRAAQSAEWPGNVRQIAHAVEAAVIRAAGSGSSVIEAQHLFPEPRKSSPPGPLTFQEATRRFQADLVSETLKETGWNVTQTAERLDLARSHVYNLIHALGLAKNDP